MINHHDMIKNDSSSRSPVLARVMLIAVLLTVLTTSAGCMGFFAQMMYVIKGHKIPAAYSGLEEKRVAVVCVSDASSYGPDTLTYTVSKIVGMKLAKEVDEIKVVQPSEIENWIDLNGNQSNFVEMGRGVNADMVVAIEIGSYSIFESQTVFKGRCELSVTTFNVQTGQVEYSFGPSEFAFPEYGRPRVQANDRQFETFYLAQLTEHIARQFYPHDELETVAENARQMR